MTRVDFYVLEEAADATVIACRLAEKAYQRHQRVMIQAADAANAKLLADLIRRGIVLYLLEVVGSPTSLNEKARVVLTGA